MFRRGPKVGKGASKMDWEGKNRKNIEERG